MSRGLRREIAFLTGLGSLALLANRNRTTAAILGLGALALAAFPGGYSFRNRAVVITGGSRGLGLALGEEFLRAGARVALLARDSDELDQARELLLERVSGEIITLSCDVTQRAELARAFERIEGVFGGVDILVNNAGVITVGPFETMDRDDFAGVLELQVHSIVNSVQLLLPQLRHSRGRVVNICSIGGKMPVPHMSSYCAAKFALAGLSASLHAELGAQGVTVTTVFPGLMRTGSVIQAVVKGDHEKEFAWFAAGDSLPILSVSARHAARRILAGIRDGDAEVVFPFPMRMAELARAAFPELFALTLREAARYFPQGSSTERRTGAESRNWLHAQPWFGPLRLLSEKAQKDYNQTERFDPDFNLGV
jgi:NAD(P)-dependent dehydrogenase (short-subunit alcohol dehydrogenase family)